MREWGRTGGHTWSYIIYSERIREQKTIRRRTIGLLPFLPQSIESCNSKIATRSTAYAKLATRFLKDRSWKESKWTHDRFLELIEPLLALRNTVDLERGPKGKQEVTCGYIYILRTKMWTQNYWKTAYSNATFSFSGDTLFVARDLEKGPAPRGFFLESVAHQQMRTALPPFLSVRTTRCKNRCSKKNKRKQLLWHHLCS